MGIDRQQLHRLIHSPLRPSVSTELRREETVFFIGGDLPSLETLETVFESHCQSPADLMVVTFGDVNSFHIGEELVRQLKKNFHVHLMGRFDYPAPPHLLQRAYAAGIDLVDIPLHVMDSGLARERKLEKEERLRSLETAKAIFGKWNVAATLAAGEEACCSTVSGIDQLLKHDIVPLVTVTARAAQYGRTEVEDIFSHLATALKRHRVVTTPLLPLLSLATPLELAKPGILKGFINRLHDRQLLATSDVRRALRVKQIEESFESAGL